MKSLNKYLPQFFMSCLIRQQYGSHKTEIVLGQLNKNKCHKILRHFAQPFPVTINTRI